MKVGDWRKTLLRGVATALVVGLMVSIAQVLNLFPHWQLAASDYLYEANGDPGQDIVIVAIDEPSLQRLGSWPWPYDAYVHLLDRLREARVIGVDVLLDVEDEAGTAALAEVTRKLGKVVYPVTALNLLPPADGRGPYQADQLIQTVLPLRQAAAGVGSVNVVIDPDGAVRRMLLLIRTRGGASQQEAFALQVLRVAFNLPAEPIRSDTGRLNLGGQFSIPVDQRGAMMINYVGQPDTFPTISCAEVLSADFDPASLRGKIVLLGWINALWEIDQHITPVSSGGYRMAGVEVQANAIHTILHHRWLSPQSTTSKVLTILLLALICGLVLPWLSVALSAGLTLLIGVGYLLVTLAFFDMGILSTPFYPILTVFLCFAAITALRFALEQRERRRVQDIFGRYVSPQVAAMLSLEDPRLVRPGGTRREISVLFADIRGFTTIAESLPPELVVNLLNAYDGPLTQAVFEQGGFLDKFTGDGIMALFGVPLSQPDHAERAVRAALAMRAAAQRVSAQRGEIEWPIRYGIGVTSGEAVVGNIGGEERMDFTAIGDVVNLAARLEGQAQADEVLISEHTYQLVRDKVKVERLPPMRVRGKKEPVLVYRVLEIEDSGQGLLSPS
ncbi:MAG: adenylate/guanylate cyclase domain-containing protein [Anaerolineae bacterium]|jgi:adenylate cyclase|nr:adenylate/guanylate cyclase domain-containing protein [Anaerolineae bacterium]MDH7475253.1 adenylate/guanylate cyclase domain-containing protein [Anaerolineae bacterium]